MKASLIFLHGGPGYADYLERFFQGAFPDTLRAVFYTQARGAGIGTETLFVQLDQEIVKCEGPVIFVGHSWGGALALEYLRANRKPVAGLVLISSFLCTKDLNAAFGRELARLGLSDPSLEQIFFTPRERESAKAFLAEIDQSFDQASYQALKQNFLQAYDAKSFVQGAEFPILNIFGTQDLRVPSHLQESYSALNKKIENIPVALAGHFPFFQNENREKIVNAITAFAARAAMARPCR